MQRWSMKSNELAELTKSELHSAQIYINRLFSALIDLSALHLEGPVKKEGILFFHDIKSFLTSKVYQSGDTQQVVKALELTEVKKLTKDAFKMIEASIDLNIWAEEEVINRVPSFINLVYKYAQKFNLIIEDQTKMLIQYPRLGLLITEKDNKESVPLFLLDPKRLTEFSKESNGRIQAIESQRKTYAEDLIKKGQESLFDDDYEQALVFFHKAQNYLETAELMTLIARACALSDQLEKAKKYCLKAIELNPDYGPSYNDLGSYLLQEGQIQESLKWFELAKRASQYQSREYPFINSGRAYMLKREYTKALEEFAKALSLTPYNEELHQTVCKLKETLNKASFKNFKEEEAGPPVF